MSITLFLVLFLGAGGVQDPAPAGPKDTLGDPLPAGAVARLGSARLLHGSLVTAVAYSPDGKLLASGGADGKIRLWDAESGKPLRVLPGGGSVQQPWVSIVFSPDSRSLAIRAGDHVRLWSSSTGDLVRSWEAPGEGEVAIAFSPDGVELGWVSPYGKLHRVEAASGRNLDGDSQEGGGGEPGLPAFAYSPEGRSLALAAGMTLRILARSGGKELAACRGHTGRIVSVAYSPDGLLVATGSQDGTLRLWDSSSGEELLSMPGYQSRRILVAFSPDGKTLASAQGPEISNVLFYQPEGLGKDRELHLWDVGTGKKKSTLKQADPGTVAFSFSPDGRRLAVAGRNSVHLWAWAEERDLPGGPGHRTAISAVAFSPDGKTIATAADHDQTIRIWEASSGTEVGDLPGCSPYQGAPHLAYFPDGKTIAQAGAPVQLWDLASEAELHWRSSRDRKDLLNGQAFQFSPDGKVVVSTVPGGTIQLRAVETGRRLHTLRGEGLSVTSVALSDDGKTLAAGYGDESVRVWDLASGKVRWTHPLGRVPELGQANRESWARVSFLPGGKALVGGHGGMMDVWELSSGKKVLELEGDWADASALLLSPDGKMVAGYKKGNVQVWELATGGEVFEDPGPEARWRWSSEHGREAGEGLFAFSPDGRTLVSAAGGLAQVFDLATGALPGASLTPGEMDERWNLLLQKDARKARAAFRDLVRAGKSSVDFLRSRLGAPPALDSEARARLMGQLASEDIRARERASQELLERASEQNLDSMLADHPSPEPRARLLELVAVLRRPLALSGTGLRVSRALQVLEAIGSPEARGLLGELSRASRLERERDQASSALLRLSLFRPEKPPSR